MPSLTSSTCLQTLEEQSEETGWKLVHGDVFRAPTGLLGPMSLSVCVGSGIQLAMMALAVTVFACFGFLSPAHRGGMVQALLVLYAFMGSFAGYVSARVYKIYNGEAWKRNTLITSLFFPVWRSHLACVCVCVCVRMYACTNVLAVLFRPRSVRSCSS